MYLKTSLNYNYFFNIFFLNMFHQFLNIIIYFILFILKFILCIYLLILIHIFKYKINFSLIFISRNMILDLILNHSNNFSINNRSHLSYLFGMFHIISALGTAGICTGISRLPDRSESRFQSCFFYNSNFLLFRLFYFMLLFCF